MNLFLMKNIATLIGRIAFEDATEGKRKRKLEKEIWHDDNRKKRNRTNKKI